MKYQSSRSSRRAGAGRLPCPESTPRKDGRRCGQHRDPAGLQNGGSLPGQCVQPLPGCEVILRVVQD